MPSNPHFHHRRSIRLAGYDYSQPGASFVTLVTLQRQCLFGEIIHGEMCLNEYGKMVWQTWQDLPNHVANVELDAFVIMPNHIHAIIIITDGAYHVGAGSEPASTQPAPAQPAPAQPAPAFTKRHGLPEIVRQFKTFSAQRVNKIRNMQGAPVWQRNYYEHILRNEEEWRHIAAYIENNPSRWQNDRENLQEEP